MGVLNIDVPESLYNRIENLAKKEGIDLDKFISLALVEKVATLETAGYIAKRANRGNSEDLLRILAKAPTQNPMSRTGYKSYTITKSLNH